VFRLNGTLEQCCGIGCSFFSIFSAFVMWFLLIFYLTDALLESDACMYKVVSDLDVRFAAVCVT